MKSEIKHSYKSDIYKEVWIKTNTYIDGFSEKMIDLVIGAITKDDKFIFVNTCYKLEILKYMRKEKLKQILEIQSKV